MTKTRLAGALLALLLLPAAAAADASTERLLRELFDRRQDVSGELIELQTPQGAFGAIHLAHRQGELRGGVVLLHDGTTNADSPEVIRPLRLALADAGWETLSLQLPGAYAGERPSSWLDRRAVIEARLQAGLDWLGTRTLPSRAVIALGGSGSVALRLAARDTPPPVQALVLISFPRSPDDADADLEALRKSTVPVLDLIAERDATPVVDGAGARGQAAIEAGRDGFRADIVVGAAPGFTGATDMLTSRVRAWLAAATGSAAPGSRP